MRLYEPSFGTCGQDNIDSDFVAAINAAQMDTATMCGKTITVTYSGSEVRGIIADTCSGCSVGDIAVSPAMFDAIAPEGDGIVRGIVWSFA